MGMPVEEEDRSLKDHCEHHACRVGTLLERRLGQKNSVREGVLGLLRLQPGERCVSASQGGRDRGRAHTTAILLKNLTPEPVV